MITPLKSRTRPREKSVTELDSYGTHGTSGSRSRSRSRSCGPMCLGNEPVKLLAN